MGQIVGLKAKPKRCNLNKLSQLGILDAGEYILVSYDNSMTANGQGNFDRYIMGDGRTAATALELKYLDDSTRPYIVEEVNKAVADIQPIEITGDVTNAPDEEDLTSENQGGTDVLKFKDKAYNSALYSGLGRVYLRKNIVTLEGTGKNVLTQAMMNTANTIYHIQYDYDLNGQTITLPAGCVLEFNGGSVKNGTITGNDTLIQGRTDLSGVTLAGSFANRSFNLYDAGCTSNDASAASDNATRMLAFIRSLENIKLTLIVPDGDWYFDTPLVFSGDFSLQCEGRLVYKADANNVTNTALTIGSSAKTFTQKHVIRLSQSTSYQFPSTPPDNIGVKFINADKCEITILESTNFVYCVVFEGNNNSCCYNNVTLGMLGYGNLYCAVKLSHVGSGWVNENLFLGGMLHIESSSVYKNNNVGISIEGTSSHASNGNVFIKPCLEGAKVGVRFAYARYNVVENMRNELVSTIHEETNSIGNIVTTEQGGNLYNFIPVVGVEKADRANILRHVVYKERTGYVTYKIGSTTYASGVRLDMTTYAGSIVGDNIALYGTNIYAGKVVDTSKAKAFSVALLAQGRCVIKCYDANNNIITPSSLGDVIVNNTSVGVAADGKTIIAQGDQNFFMFVFTASVKKAFIGCLATKSEYIEVSAYTTNANSELGIPIAVGTFNDILPLTQANVEVGDVIINKIGQKLIWSGTKWVNEEGFTAARNKGTTAERPTNLSVDDVGFPYFDTDLVKGLLLSSRNVEVAQITAARNEGSNQNPSRESHANPLQNGVLYYAHYSIKQSWGGKVTFRKTDSVQSTDADEITIFPNYDNVVQGKWITAPDPTEYPYIYTSNAWASAELITFFVPQTYWIEQDGATAGVLRHGLTADRPAASDIYVGFEYFDETLGKPIYWNGTAYVDTTGTAV